MKHIFRVLFHRTVTFLSEFTREIAICLLYCSLSCMAYTHPSHNRPVQSRIEGQLSLNAALRTSQVGTLTLSYKTKLNQTARGQLEFRLPKGVTPLSPVTFSSTYFGIQEQRSRVSIRIDAPGHYPLQASLYSITSDGYETTEHFYLYLKTDPSQAEISPYPLISYQQNRELQSTGDLKPLSANDISVGGKLTYYNDNQRQPRPLARVKVLLVQSDILLETTFSNLKGDYLFQGLVMKPEKPKILRIVVEMENDILVLRAPNREIYTFESDPIRNVETGYIERNLTLDVNNPNRGTGYIFESIQKAHDFVETQVNSRRTKPINVIWPEPSNGSFYYAAQSSGRINNESVHIATGPDQWRKSVMYHEYGHALMSAMYDYNFDTIPRGEYRKFHTLAMVTDLEFAFSEGWAEFFEAAVDNRAMDLTGFLDGRTPNVENNKWWSGKYNGGGSNSNGALVEGAVASILWDIFDTSESVDLSPNTDDDQIQNRFDLLWQIILRQKPKNILQIAEHWRDEEYPQWDALQSIYANHRALSNIKTVPILTFTTPNQQTNIPVGSNYEISWTTNLKNRESLEIDVYYYGKSQTPKEANLISRQVVSSNLVWDTTKVPNGRYHLLAVFNNTEGKMVQIPSKFTVIIDQSPLQPPKINLVTNPEIQGIDVTNSSPVFDLSVAKNGSTSTKDNIFSYLLDQKSDTIPDTEVDPRVLDGQLRFYELESGMWWLHVRAYDPLDYWSETQHLSFTVLPSIIDKPSTNVLEYLIELSMSELKASKLKKWTSEIRLQPYGFLTNRDLSVLLDTTAVLNGLMETTQIRITKDNPNFKVYFYPSVMLRAVEPDYRIEAPSFVSNQPKRNQIASSKVLIDSFRTNQTQRDYLIRKCVTQGLGLTLDSNSYPDSIFYQRWNGVTRLSPLDKQVIRLLYSDQVLSGMTAQKLLELGTNQQKKPNLNELVESTSGDTTTEEANILQSETLTGDINKDGTVDVFDLVITAASFGKTGTGLLSDVNNDNRIDVLDLVIVSSNVSLSEAFTPSTIPQVSLSSDEKRNIMSAIDQLSSNFNKSSAKEIALNILKSILPERLPARTRLLANYPNPFNPETWIPFQLAKDSIVRITIYDSTGKQVKLIDLGQLVAGNYVEPGKAILWDGKTDNGGLVVSGSYFYQIESEDYREIRKMVIAK